MLNSPPSKMSAYSLLCMAIIGAMFAATTTAVRTRAMDGGDSEMVVVLTLERLEAPQSARASFLAPAWSPSVWESRHAPKSRPNARLGNEAPPAHHNETEADDEDRATGCGGFFAATPASPQLGLFAVTHDSTILVFQTAVNELVRCTGGGDCVEHYDAVRRVPHDHHHDAHHHGHLLHGGVRHPTSVARALTVPLRAAQGGQVVALHAVITHGSDPAYCRGGDKERDDASCFRRDRTHFHELSYSVTTQAIMASRGIQVSALQETNPAYARSMAFVAAGYLASQSAKFQSDVAKCFNALKGLDSTLDAAPWPRYVPLLNVYTVFEPSLEAGASRLTGPNHDCSAMETCGPSVVQNNLHCEYGTPDPSRLACKPELVLSLASFAPSADIVVVLVNDADIGGTSFSMTSTVSTSSEYLTYLLLHELNHAVAGLGDEYSHKFTEPSPSTSSIPPNCALTSRIEYVDWYYWVSQGALPSTPTQGCTFDNLYRPTNSSCIMSTASSVGMCSVCRERLTTSLFTGGVGLRIDQPRCPPVSMDVYVNASDSITLTVNDAFVLQNTNVSVVWTMADGSTVTGVPAVTVSGSTLSTGLNVVRVAISDFNPYVRPARRTSGMSLTSTFNVRLWQPTSLCTPSTCTSASGVAYSYCGICTAAAGCSTDRLVTPVTYTSPPTATDLSQQQSAVNATAIILGAVGGGVLLLTVLVNRLYQSRIPEEVYDRTATDDVLGFTVMLNGALSLALAVITIVFAVVYLPRAAVFGNDVFVGCIILACVVFLAALLKLVSALLRAHVLSAVFGVVLCLVGAGLFGIGVFAIYIYQNRNSVDLVATFGELWLRYTASSPDAICAIQNAFSCSGYYASCNPTTSSYCPANCNYANQHFVNPCMDPWLAWASEKSLRVGAVTLLCGFFFAVAALVDCIHCVGHVRARLSARGRRSYRKDENAPVVPITSNEAAQVRQAFGRVCDSNGKMEGARVVEFVTNVFGERPPPQDCQMLETAGPMTCQELLQLYFPNCISSQIDPRKLTAQEAEGASDVVELERLQFAKLEKFMAAAGTLSPAALQHIYQEYAKNHFLTDSKEVLDVIRSAALHEADSEEALMCSGLSFQELEGLRSAWITINPAVEGDLDDDQLDLMFQWTHGTILHSHEHFVRWKDMLDVRKTGAIGWGEFCYPFAQRARLTRAREYLFAQSREVPHEMLTKGQVADEFGPEFVHSCFMIFEEVIPIERVVEAALRAQEAHQQNARR